MQLHSEDLTAEVHVTSAERLTPPSTVAGLESSFLFKGQPVVDLWRLGLRFVNTGTSTIIGRGNRKSIVNSGLQLQFARGVTIMDMHEGTSSFPHVLEQPAPGLLELRFAQWRPDEELVYSLFISTDEPMVRIPLPVVPERELINGHFSVVDSSGVEPEPREPPSVLSMLPSALGRALRLIGVLCALAMTVAFCLMAVFALRETKRWRAWHSEYGEAFEEYVSQMEPSKALFPAEVLIQRPWLLTEELWEGFIGPPCPVRSPMAKTWAGLVFAALFFVLLALGLLAVAANAIYL